MVSKESSFGIKIRKASEALLLGRYLLTKFYRRKNGLTSTEEVLLYLLVDWYSSCRMKKQDSQNVKLLALLRLMSLHFQFRDKEFPNWAKAQQKILFSQVSLSPRAELGLGTSFIERFLKRTNRLLWKTPPPARYIGVGYRDKGAAKVLSYDGTPSWKDLAVRVSNPYVSKDTMEERARRILEEGFSRILNLSS
jgi:hypothetical protein